ncbi:MAG: hypothetical protein L0Z48_06490 [candidate division Zixibacteria bacterium]|nr:hypothetical protein [candidate division Zixibacteria bacterium]MCI0596172.1 hypothetical protein [candidate division Zixibacteria bacterium]
MKPHFILFFDLAGLLFGFLALLFPNATMIFVFFSSGNLLILIGLGGYVGLVLKDLKKHRVL